MYIIFLIQLLLLNHNATKEFMVWTCLSPFSICSLILIRFFFNFHSFWFYLIFFFVVHCLHRMRISVTHSRFKWFWQFLHSWTVTANVFAQSHTQRLNYNCGNWVIRGNVRNQKRVKFKECRVIKSTEILLLVNKPKSTFVRLFLLIDSQFELWFIFLKPERIWGAKFE